MAQNRRTRIDPPKPWPDPGKKGPGTEGGVIKKLGLTRSSDFLYYIDKEGDVSRAKMARGGKRGGRPEKVQRVRLKKEKGYLYYLNKKGDVARAKMVNA